MKVSKCVCIALIGLMLSVSPALAEGDGKLSVAVGTWLQELDGSVKVTEGAVIGDTLNLQNTLGLDDDSPVCLSFTYKGGPNYKIKLNYASMENEGRKQMTQQITYKGINYDADTLLTSSIKTTLIDIDYYRYLKETDTGKVSLLLGLRMFDFEASITGEVINVATTRAESFDAPIPVIGLAGYTQFNEKIKLYGQVGWLEVDSGDDGGAVTDLDLGLVYKIQDDLKAVVGYRMLDLEADSGDDHAEMEFSGVKFMIMKKF